MSYSVAATPHIDGPQTEQIVERCVCPRCQRELNFDRTHFQCRNCAEIFPIVNGIFDLRPRLGEPKPEAHDWSQHWSDSSQRSFAQRFFSLYRKAVFARTVRHFTDRYFSGSGVFVEAGSGTSETSMRMNKLEGQRVLVALDLVLPALSRCHPIMDLRICGDIFHLPFRDNSLDGIWNVGVMEHFTHPQIDTILSEFWRVLRPGGRIILLWPAIYSLPQRILRVFEFFINLRNQRQQRFRFHPDEISQVRSLRHGRQILRRNNFNDICVDPGLRSLLAFEILVGEKLRARTRTL